MASSLFLVAQDAQAVITKQVGDCQSGDCRALVNQNKDACHSDDCRAMLDKKEENCGTQDCQVVIAATNSCLDIPNHEVSPLCQTANCRALVQNSEDLATDFNQDLNGKRATLTYDRWFQAHQPQELNLPDDRATHFVKQQKPGAEGNCFVRWLKQLCS